MRANGVSTTALGWGGARQCPPVTGAVEAALVGLDDDGDKGDDGRDGGHDESRLERAVHLGGGVE